MTTLKEGDKAPAFSGINQNGEIVRLNDFAGKKLILFFYPKDNTPGCTAEACNLNNNYSMWLEKGFVVLGVSPDNIDSHKKFKQKYGLNYDLISDTSKELLQSYGVWGEKNMYGKKYMGVLRTTFVINEEGIIEKIIEKVKTKDHTNQLITSLKI